MVLQIAVGDIGQLTDIAPPPAPLPQTTPTCAAIEGHRRRSDGADQTRTRQASTSSTGELECLAAKSLRSC